MLRDPGAVQPVKDTAVPAARARGLPWTQTCWSAACDPRSASSRDDGDDGGMDIRVVVGPDVDADLRLVEEILARECDVSRASGLVEVAADAAGLELALRRVTADPTCAVVVAPGSREATEQLLAVCGPVRAVWFDPAATGPVQVGESGDYVYGRGLGGLVWAVRRAVNRLSEPARRIPYGPHPDQWGELRLPATGDPGGWPVAVLILGGYWRSVWGADLMDGLALDLVGRGFAVWNLEYRRPDLCRWEATTADVAAGLAALSDTAMLGDISDSGGRADLTRVAVIGHSAGGQLTLRLAADTALATALAREAATATNMIKSDGTDGKPVRVAVAVSLAGDVDLAEGARLGLSNGAVAAALGGPIGQRPETYAEADPMARLPIGVPTLIVQGEQDDPHLVDMNRRYVAAARAAGDEVTQIQQPGDHFAVIDRASKIWCDTAAVLVDRLRPILTGGSVNLRAQREDPHEPVR